MSQSFTPNVQNLHTQSHTKANVIFPTIQYANPGVNTEKHVPKTPSNSLLHFMPVPVTFYGFYITFAYHRPNRNLSRCLKFHVHACVCLCVYTSLGPQQSTVAWPITPNSPFLPSPFHPLSLSLTIFLHPFPTSPNKHGHLHIA